MLPSAVKDELHNLRAVLRLLDQEHSPAPLFAWLRNVRPLCRRSSMLSDARLIELYRLALRTVRDRIRGDFVECGVAAGGSAAVLAHAALHAAGSPNLWLFDSFQGLPAPTARDGMRATPLRGACAADAQQVTNVLGEIAFPVERTHIRAGWFDLSFPQAGIAEIAMLHIDADWYESVTLCLERFYDLLSPGAVVVIDDYNDWPGCRRSVEDFQRARNLRFDIVQNGDGAPYFRLP